MSLEKIASKLEGKYFVAVHKESDLEYAGECLALLRLEKGKLIGITGHQYYAEELENDGTEITEEIIKVIKRKRIREVYTIWAFNQEVFGWHLGEERNEDDDYSDYQPVCFDDDYGKKLRERGINLYNVDPETCRIRKVKYNKKV